MALNAGKGPAKVKNDQSGKTSDLGGQAARLRGGGDAAWQPVDIVAHHNASRPQDAINPDSRKAWGKLMLGATSTTF